MRCVLQVTHWHTRSIENFTRGVQICSFGSWFIFKMVRSIPPSNLKMPWKLQESCTIKSYVVMGHPHPYFQTEEHSSCQNSSRSCATSFKSPRFKQVVTIPKPTQVVNAWIVSLGKHNPIGCNCYLVSGSNIAAHLPLNLHSSARLWYYLCANAIYQWLSCCLRHKVKSTTWANHGKYDITHKIATENIKASQAKYESQFDKKAQTSTYREGQKVWLYWAKSTVGLSPKMCHKWLGPYSICEARDNFT